MSHNPDQPVVSNPPERRDLRSLRQRLEEGSDGRNESTLARFILKFGEEITEEFGDGAIRRLEALGDLAAAVRVRLAAERAVESSRGSADEMSITFKGQRDGTIRATAKRFGDQAVIIGRNEELVLRPGPIGQVTAFLVQAGRRVTRTTTTVITDEPPPWVDTRQSGGVIAHDDVYSRRYATGYEDSYASETTAAAGAAPQDDAPRPVETPTGSPPDGTVVGNNDGGPDGGPP